MKFPTFEIGLMFLSLGTAWMTACMIEHSGLVVSLISGAFTGVGTMLLAHERGKA